MNNRVLLVVTLLVLLSAVSTAYLYLDQKNISERLQQKLTVNESRLIASNQDKAILLSSLTSKFDAGAFGYSVLNTDILEMKVNTYWYRGEEIIQREAALDQRTKSGRQVILTSWDYKNLPPYKQRSFDPNLNAVAISYTESGLQYVNPFAIRFTRSCGELSTKRNITSSRTVYLQIQGDSCIGLHAETANSDIIYSTKELESVARNINAW